MVNPAESTPLLSAVTQLRGAVDDSTLPLELPGVGAARTGRSRLLDQLDDYIIPRLTTLDAPLLAVVGGSTGAGKSTLVNSIIGREVTMPGVLRPTTRSPVLIHHPADVRWFEGQRVLPSLARITGKHSASDGPGAVRLVSTDVITPGLALIDAPDIDSVVSANRNLAAQLLAAADLWIFVTTAARYADAVPWDLLREASERGTAVAVVLDRVPPTAVDEIRTHLAFMLREQGLKQAPIFTVVESALDRGLLPQQQTQQLRRWLNALAGNAQARASVVRQTLTGALESLDGRAGSLAEASAAQVAACDDLLAAARDAYEQAVQHVRDGMQDGTLLRGEVLARWQEFVGTGEFFKQVESTVARVRDRVTAFIRGGSARAEHLGEALQTGVAALVSNRAEIAASTASRAWRTQPGGDQLLVAHPDLLRSSEASEDKTRRLVREWQDDILDMVRAEGRDRRTTARIMAYGVNGLGVLLMLVTFGATAGLTGAELGIAGGTAVVGQKLLEAVFGDQAVRELSRKARERLLERVAESYAAELARYERAVTTLGVRVTQGAEVAEAAATVRRALEAGLAPAGTPTATPSGASAARRAADAEATADDDAEAGEVEAAVDVDVVADDADEASADDDAADPEVNSSR